MLTGEGTRPCALYPPDPLSDSPPTRGREPSPFILKGGTVALGYGVRTPTPVRDRFPSREVEPSPGAAGIFRTHVPAAPGDFSSFVVEMTDAGGRYEPGNVCM